MDSIKQAIFDYGPISVAICAGGHFIVYTGGVFNHERECPPFNPVNHAVVLVGWDDNQGENGVWILRNSWGEDWGEDGYMLIEHGCSKIGYFKLLQGLKDFLTIKFSGIMSCRYSQRPR